jgi:hypothetical protein
MPRTPRAKLKRRPPLEVRTTVSLEREAYCALADIAYERRVSIGCVVREAVATYLDSDSSGFPKSMKGRT